MDIKLVADVGEGRAIVYENAPYLPHPECIVLPFIQLEGKDPSEISKKNEVWKSLRRTGALFFVIDWIEQWKQPVIRYDHKPCEQYQELH